MTASTNPLVPNATFIVEVITFLIILFILARYAIPPVSRAMRDRQEQIRSSLEEAEKGRELLRKAQVDYEAKMTEARAEARALLDHSTRMGEQVREEMRARAQAECDAMIARAQAEIGRASERAADELRRQTADLVMDATQRVLQRHLPADLQRALIEETAAGVGSGG